MCLQALVVEAERTEEAVEAAGDTILDEDTEDIEATKRSRREI